MNVLDLLLNRMETARQWTCSLLTDIDPSQWFREPASGVQHVAWQVGHLTASQAALVFGRCFGRNAADHLPDGYVARFGRGSKPVGDPAAYPTPAEIRSAFDRVHEEALALVRSMPAAELDRPASGDPHPMFATKAQCLAMVAMHESFHAGQIALTRRLFGKSALR